jgi:acetyl esterase/lipase
VRPCPLMTQADIPQHTADPAILIGSGPPLLRRALGPSSQFRGRVKWEELAGAYVPEGIDRRDPRVSPLFADLKGFPPTLIQVGSAETLLADAARFATAAGTADVAVTPRDLAPYDSRVAFVERTAGSRQTGAGRCRQIYWRTSVIHHAMPTLGATSQCVRSPGRSRN